MELIYKGKNAIVTGASGGMGLEISKMLSENNINAVSYTHLTLPTTERV